MVNLHPNQKKAIAILDQYGAVYDNGFIRFKRDNNRVSTFMFHVDEIRTVFISQGVGSNTVTGKEVQVIRLEISLIGGSASTCAYHPERDIDGVMDFANALLCLRDEACGVSGPDYEIELHQDYFYTGKPNVSWPDQDETAE
ncbi:hypothetical protein pEaSNUABM14_00055 [Erwinia phage pEa_SNUABM_14]|nr:hypothetical protein pEaSNUABM45_00055 [Erwinia phage pEa_SNUABM_45]QYW04039.1 hypothetical protein pEaSNUABM46_00055 [Erwinia phage pEa_SNUABM_46]QYW04380.1 hypothetical protein pEaSNUABM14_00055 [Erwinia phage pEa_SNUABM_14]